MTNNTLPESSSFKILGLTFTSNMSWTKYISDITKAAAKKVGSFNHARKFTHI